MVCGLLISIGPSCLPAQGAAQPTEAVCRNRTPCRLVASHPAGVGRSVFEIALHDRKDENWKHPDPKCAPYEYWLAHHSDDRGSRVQLLAALCNDGYGARGMGEDRVEIDDNRFTLAQIGGSAWMW